MGARRSLLAAVGAVLMTTPAVAVAQSGPAVPPTPNDLFALGQGTGDTPARVASQRPAEPPYTATPLVPCGPGSKPQPGVDGRVPAGSGANGLWGNPPEIAHQGTPGGVVV